MMHWVLQGNIFNESAWEEFVSTLERFELSHSEHKVVPMVGAIVPPDWQGEISDDPSSWPPNGLEDKKNVIVIGSYSLRHTARVYGWYPGSFDLMEVGNFERCREKWGEHMLNYNSVVVPFKDAYWPEGEVRFLRPVNDSKNFAGRVYESDEFREWQKNVCILKLDYGNSLTSDTLIQVAPWLPIQAEYRCWVVKGKVVTMSLYKLGERVIYHNFDGVRGDLIREYAQARVDEWQPTEAFVIDVCETPQGMRIVEINTINSCGFYAADIQKLVNALHEGFSK